MSSHVRNIHGIDWKDYQKDHPVVEIPEDKGKPGDKAPEEAKEPDDLPLDKRMDRLENIVNKLVNSFASENPSGVYDFPGEDIEIIGEKVNYKVALNPAIFSRYDKFKAVVKRRGKEWTKDFADFLDMSTKDILAVYGIYDTVVEFRDGRILVEVPEGLSGIV